MEYPTFAPPAAPARCPLVVRTRAQRACQPFAVSTLNSLRPRSRPTMYFVMHANAEQGPQRALPSCFPAAAAASVVDPLARRMMEETLIADVTVPTLCDSSIATTYFCAGNVQCESPAVVFLPGFDSNILEYRRLAEEMRTFPFLSYFVDLLGWGFTEKPPVSPTLCYSPADKRAHLFAWKRSVLGPEPIVLAGASIGGGAAIDFALHHPEDVKALVLIGAQAYMDKKASAALAVPVFGNLFATFGAKVLQSKWLRKIAVFMSYHDETLRRSEEVEAIGGLHTRTKGWLEANASFIRGEGYCVSKRVKDLHMPALIIYGEEDAILPSAENARRFSNDLSRPDQVSILPIPSAGHTPHIEKAPEVAKAVATFMNTLDQT